MNWLPILLALTLTTSCTRKLMTDDERKADYARGIKPLLAQHQASVTAVLAALKVIPKAGAAEPPVTALQPLPAPVVCNADTCMIATAEPVGKISLSSAPSLLDFEDVPRVLRGEYAAQVTWQRDKNTLEAIDALTHFAIVRVHQYEKPAVGSTAERYTGGHAAGDVIVYDVKTQKRVGAFTWTAEMPETVHIPADSTDPAAAYEREFVGAAREQIRTALDAFYAGKAAEKGPSDDEHLRERQIQTLLAQDVRVMVLEVEISDSPTCKVVLVAVPQMIAANPDAADGVVKPEAVKIVRQVMGKDCAVTYRAMQP
jgi:hypothetical protein